MIVVLGVIPSTVYISCASGVPEDLRGKWKNGVYVRENETSTAAVPIVHIGSTPPDPMTSEKEEGVGQISG